MATDRETFSNIYRTGAWSEQFSMPLSGPGSTVENSLPVIDIITTLHAEGSISSILDVGCGDLEWIQSVEPIRTRKLRYYGLDLVPEVIERNKAHHSWFRGACENALECRKFDADLVLIKDVAFHMTNPQISQLLEILRRSTWRYCLLSCYECASNEGRTLDSQYHFAEANLTLPPFGIDAWREKTVRPADGIFLLIEPHHLQSVKTDDSMP